MSSIVSEAVRLSISTACALWAAKEGHFHRDAEALATPANFAAWFCQWKLRGLTTNQRLRVIEIAWDARPSLLNCTETSENAWRLVNDLANRLKRNPHISKHLLSLAAKFAFTLRPMVFSPYDKYACAGLNKQSSSICRRRDYVEFMSQFTAFLQTFARHVNGNPILASHLEAQMHAHDFTAADRPLLLRRACDKFLMLEGGFPYTLMNRDALRCDPSIRSNSLRASSRS
jgi:hypothetical protein